jgi:aspartyl-tRNA(Asn)/glutamyl-tRNA(Gln) amidotransferase subunit A
MYLSDVFTIPVNLAGLPGIVLPCGVDERGLPIGLQIVGPPFGEEIVLRAARAFERATEWHRLRPPDVATAAGVAARREAR